MKHLLLVADNDVNWALIAACFAILIAAILITRSAFSIPTIVRNTKVQTELLRAIAEKSGVEEDRIDGIMNGLLTSWEAYDNRAKKINQKNTKSV